MDPHQQTDSADFFRNVVEPCLLRAVSDAALAAWEWSGCGDSHAADGAATAAMRRVFSAAPFGVRIVIGEGERDGAPHLAPGELLGCNGMAGDRLREGACVVDCAVDPLEGTSLLASGRPGALAVAVLASEGGVLGAPDFYMEKLACPPHARARVCLSQTPSQRVAALAAALDKPVHSLCIAVQDRPRHRRLVAELQNAGAQVSSFAEGDVAIALQAASGSGRFDALMGIGAAPEGVIAAAAIRCLGGLFQGRFVYDPEEVMSGLIGTCTSTNRQRVLSAGISDPDAHLDLLDLVPAKDLVVGICGITCGDLVAGVEQQDDGTRLTSSLLFRLGQVVPVSHRISYPTLVP